MKKGIIFLLGLFLTFGMCSSSIAEDAAEDSNHVPGLLGHYLGVGGVPETRRIMTDDDRRLYVNTVADYGTTALIDGVTLDDDPVTTNGVLTASEMKKLCFFVSYDETEVENTVSGTITVEVGDGAGGWIDFDLIIDQNGIGSPQSSIEYTIDDTDVFYVPAEFYAETWRITFTGTNTDADDTIVVSVFASYQN